MAVMNESVLVRLRDAVGTDERVSVESGGTLRVQPATTEQVAAVMHMASAQGLSVSPVGGGTKAAWGYPVASQILLDLRGLAGVREHAWQDLTATVGAGTTWAGMQSVLGKQGQCVAVDALFPERATVGGVLGVNDSGLLRMKYGSLRDLLLGVTLVLSDGTIARSGGKVVKNVAGYDLPKLLIGSFGTLAVVTEATFRLHPVQTHAKSFTVRSMDVRQVEQVMKAALAASLSIERMQLRNESTAFALDIELATAPEALSEQKDRLRKLAGELPFEEADSPIWNERERLVGTENATVLKIMALPAKLAALTAGFAQLSQMPDHSFQAVTDPAGILTVACVAPAESIMNVLEELRSRLRSSSGHVVVLNRGALPRETDVWGGDPAAIDVMRAVKTEFDPTRTLNPGKFVGGL